MIRYLGDVHLGKRWKHGVPMHRRGDRERIQWAEFEAHLNDVQPGDFHVQVGDLFDEAIVPYGVIWRAARAYQKAAETNPGVVYIVDRGNHDASRDLERVTAFQIFEAIVGQQVAVVSDEAQLFFPPGGERLVVMPWHPFHNAGEMVVRHEDILRDADIVVGHWDVDGRQAESDNFIPARSLKALGVKRAVTGHDHNAREEKIDGLDVVVTGSMQPYDHSQDPDERFYVTRSLETVLENVDGWSDKHLRVTLKPGEVLDTQIDCLQLSVMREGQAEEAVAIDVEFEEFDFNALLGLAISEVGLSDKVEAAMRAKMAELRLQETDPDAASD